MRSILVTGGAGFIGSHTVVELTAAGYRPVIIDNLSNSEATVLANLEKLTGQSLAFYQQDYQDVAKLKTVLETERISAVIHFAAHKAVSESVDKPLEYYENNVSGLITFLQALAKQPTVKQLVFSSSCTVYGEPDALPVTEQSPIKTAESPYGATKQMGETILHDSVTISKTLNALALRYFNPIGAHSSGLIGELPKGVPANLVPFVTQAAAGLRDQLTVFGNDYPTPDGSCIRDYIHVVDLAKAHVKALQWLEKQPVAAYDVVNVGTGQGSSVLEVLHAFEKATGRKVPYTIGARRPGDIIATYASVEKAKKLLGWQAEKDLAKALTDAWHWQQTLATKPV